MVVLLDGARQNFDSGHDGRFFVDPSLLRQVEVLRGPASSLYGSGGTGVLAVLHDLNLAALYADRLVLLQAGRVAAAGPPEAVLTEAGIAAVFELPVTITRHPTRGVPQVIAL